MRIRLMILSAVHASRKDNIVYDITPQAGQMPGVSASGWGQPIACILQTRARLRQACP